MANVSESRSAQRVIRDSKRNAADVLRSALRWVMSDPRGRLVMYDLIDKRCLVFSASYTGNSETFVREGKRAVGIELMKELQENHKDEYVQMISEAFSLQRRDALTEEAARTAAQTETEE